MPISGFIDEPQQTGSIDSKASETSASLDARLPAKPVLDVASAQPAG